MPERGCRCRLWVKLRSSGMSALSLLPPDEQTLIAAVDRSVRCHKQTSSFWQHAGSSMLFFIEDDGASYGEANEAA